MLLKDSDGEAFKVTETNDWSVEAVLIWYETIFRKLWKNVCYKENGISNLDVLLTTYCPCASKNIKLINKITRDNSTLRKTNNNIPVIITTNKCNTCG